MKLEPENGPTVTAERGEADPSIAEKAGSGALEPHVQSCVKPTDSQYDSSLLQKADEALQGAKGRA